jgi:hypothetical protein
MNDRVAATGLNAVQGALQRAAHATGVDFSLLVETARRESAFNPTARAGTSSATGLFQFIDSTWLDMVRRHGAEHGLATEAAALQRGADGDTRRAILALRTDPELSARMAGELARENAMALEARLGRAPSAGELYAAHVMGPVGAARLIEAAQRGEPNAAALFPREANANRGIFYADGVPRSARAVLERLSLDADATLSSPAAPTFAAENNGMLSPALAHALFALSLLPLINGGDEERSDPLQALSAYKR